MRYLLLTLSLLSAFSYAAFDSVYPQWRYTNYQIDYNSVCFNYVKNTVEWRSCRGKAVSVFRDLCSKYDKQSARTGDQQDIAFRQMYCNAASGYSPV